jgi:hypothetical protein
MSRYPHASTIAYSTFIDFAVCASGSLALVTYGLLFYREFGVPSIIEIAKRNRNLDLHVMPAPLTLLSKMTATPKEAREKIERIMPSPLPAALFVLFHPFMTVLVVYAASLRVAQSIIRLCDLDEFVFGIFITAADLC